ncbi:hypothetical protein [Pseudoduganella aquatica]|uniref:Uncharacterized protein n=1 Tax=Pseudoduganella aquatica TaxID=2660641 RepID=A0A7X4KMM9_9BURK|nr:hypothetical protein [Pseudoduganella aquatica]MYN08005.1 hypothetical protein [Pseudoduganella aquatica]
MPLLSQVGLPQGTASDELISASLIARIEASLALLQEYQGHARELAESIRGNGRALEGMPYALIKEIDSIAMDLDIAQWYDEDGFAPEITPILGRVQSWLTKLPRDV